MTMKRCSVVVCLLVVFCSVSDGGTYTHHFRDGLLPAFSLSLDTNAWSAATGSSGLTIKRTNGATLDSPGWTLSCNLAELTRTRLSTLAGDFSVTVKYSGYTGWKPTGGAQNRLYLIGATWGYLGGEYAYILRNHENNWWNYPPYWPDSASRMVASIEGDGPFIDWGTLRTDGTVTMTRTGSAMVMTVDDVVLFSGPHGKLDARPGLLSLWISASLDGMLSLPEVTIESLTITAPEICSARDLSGNCLVDYDDFAVLSDWWMDGCGPENQWCQGADLNFSKAVDIEDLLKIAAMWLD